jgi:hypothetical protein
MTEWRMNPHPDSILGLNCMCLGGSVVYYESRKLNEHEVNYVTHNLELDAIVHALKCGGITSWEGNLYL